MLSAVAAKDGSVGVGIVQERISFLIGKTCRVRVWWNEETRVVTPDSDHFTAVVEGVVPIGRDY